ncbi:MAG: hypothetical protein AUG49_11225 [Catenulispora sp. 13_1_20CM_3_70_7]|nr:MAG: hypothetical protein AUG49_11225 [Catenulispora sp. 13_1_20CM_3_70_7]
MSRALVSAGVLAAVAGAVALPTTSAQAAAQHGNGHIAWAVNTAGWNEANADGSNAHAVTPSGGGYAGTGHVIQVAYSPDGTKVAFAVAIPASGGAVPTVELWVADASGANARLFLKGATAMGQPVWSPDGTKIYISLSEATAANRIDVIDVSHGPGSGVTALPQDANCSASSPTVAPNGRVAFVELCAGAGMPIAVTVDPGATAPRRLNGFRPEQMAFSPDGTWIAYLQSEGPNIGLFIIPANGGSRVQISTGSRGGTVSWAPDGASLLTWTSKSTGGPDEVGVLNKVATKPNSPLMPIETETSPDIGYSASWQTGASTAPARPAADRIGGADRIETSVRASQWSFDATGTGGRQAAGAVITRSDTFADALAGNALAAEKDGPLFMTDTAALDQRVKNELGRILPPGANVYILGGTRALSTKVDDAVAALGFKPVRLAGDGNAYADDRYGTAQAIAAEITGFTWTGGSPVPNAAPHSVFVTQAYLAKLDPAKTHVYTVGGQATTAVAKAFPQWKGLTTPLSGADRFETAYLVATRSMFGPALHEVGVATATNWPDALSGGALIGLRHGPLLLAGADGLSAQELSVLKAPGLGGIAVFGGTAVVSDPILSATADAAFGKGAWDKGSNRQAPALK